MPRSRQKCEGESNRLNRLRAYDRPGLLLAPPWSVTSIQSRITEVLEHLHHQQQPRSEQGTDTKTNGNRKHSDFSGGRDVGNPHAGRLRRRAPGSELRARVTTEEPVRRKS